MNVNMSNNPLQPGPSPVCYFLAYTIFRGSQKVCEGNTVLCTSESLEQLRVSVLESAGLSPNDCSLIFTSLTVISTEVANQLIFGTIK